MDLFFALHKPKEFHNTPHGKGHAMSILSVCNIKCCRTALYFAGEEREVYLLGGHEMRGKGICNLPDKRLKLFELIVRERRPSKPHRIIRLWTRTVERYGVIPTFIDTFN